MPSSIWIWLALIATAATYLTFFTGSWVEDDPDDKEEPR